MKPFPENANTPRIERVFNYRLSRARMTAETLLADGKGDLLGSQRECMDIEVSCLDSIVAASCILHNICEVQNNAFLPHWELEHVHDEPVMPVYDHNANDAVDIQDCLAQYFISHPYYLVVCHLI
jgi:hypothetical protein